MGQFRTKTCPPERKPSTRREGPQHGCCMGNMLNSFQSDCLLVHSVTKTGQSLASLYPPGCILIHQPWSKCLQQPRPSRQVSSGCLTRHCGSSLCSIQPHPSSVTQTGLPALPLLVCRCLALLCSCGRPHSASCSIYHWTLFRNL